MIVVRRAVLALALFAPSGPTAARATPIAATTAVINAIDGFIRPAYGAFHHSTTALRERLDALCAAPSPAALDDARSAFAASVAAWSTVEVIRFGPVTEENRLERVLFWPDRKGTGLKQVQAALAAEDQSTIDAGSLAGKSVAMQGLGALEFVLYGRGAETLTSIGGQRCRYGAVIAANLDGIGASIEAAWAAPGGFAAQWSKPGPQNPLYRDDGEALTELVDTFINGLELIRDQRLGGFLAATHDADRPKQALFWRSQLTTASLAANMNGLLSLFTASRLTDVLPDDQRWIGQSADAQLENGEKAAAGVTGDIAAVLTDPARREQLVFFRSVTSSLSELFGTRVTGALGLSAGFSSLDGD